MDNVKFDLSAVDLSDPAMLVTLALVSDNNGALRCIGTGFMVHPGLAITAEHIVADWLTFQEKIDGYKNKNASFSVTAIQYTSEGRFVSWILDHYYASESTDVAFLSFKRPTWLSDDESVPVARLSLHPPTQGDVLRSVGFPDSSMSRDGVLRIAPTQSLLRVRKYQARTETRSRAASYLEVDGEVAGGMSGGPVFDVEGNVVGFNSRGGLPAVGDLPALSVIGLLWPSFSVDVRIFNGELTNVLMLFASGPAKALGLERVHITSDQQIRLSTFEPSAQEATDANPTLTSLSNSIDFSYGIVREILARLREISLSLSIDNVDRRFHADMRLLFWELESLLETVLRLAAVRVGLDASAGASWEALQAALEALPQIESVDMDDLFTLKCTWRGQNLYEVKAYATMARRSGLTIQAIAGAEGRLLGVLLEPSRKGGSQLRIPDGLENLARSTFSFVRRLKSLADSLALDSSP